MDKQFESDIKRLNQSLIPENQVVLPIEIPKDIRSWVLGQIPESNLRSIVFRRTYRDFQTAGLTFDLTLLNLPPNSEILSCWMNVRTAFAGTTTCTMSIGPDATETALQTAQDVKTAGLKKAIGTDFTASRAIYNAITSTAIQAKATATIENLSSLSAGEIDFYFLYYNYPRTG